MPIYEYKCNGCNKVLEVIQRFSDAPRTECTECGGSLEKLISNTSFVLKGSGWYADGYSNSSSPDNGKTESKPASKPATDKKDKKDKKKAEPATTAA